MSMTNKLKAMETWLRRMLQKKRAYVLTVS